MGLGSEHITFNRPFWCMIGWNSCCRQWTVIKEREQSSHLRKIVGGGEEDRRQGNSLGGCENGPGMSSAKAWNWLMGNWMKGVGGEDTSECFVILGLGRVQDKRPEFNSSWQNPVKQTHFFTHCLIHQLFIWKSEVYRCGFSVPFINSKLNDK